MAAGVGVVWRDAHQAMDAAFALQPAIGVFALDQHGGGLDAGGLAAVLVDFLDLVAARVGVAHIHAAQHRGPVLAFRAAGARVYLDIAVVRVDFAGQKSLEFGVLGFLQGQAKAGLHFGQRALVALGLRHLPELDRVACLALQFADVVHAGLEPVAFTHQRLRFLGVVPEIRAFRKCVQFGQALFGKAPVKDASAAGLPTAGSSRPCFRLQAS